MEQALQTLSKHSEKNKNEMFRAIDQDCLALHFGGNYIIFQLEGRVLILCLKEDGIARIC